MPLIGPPRPAGPPTLYLGPESESEAPGNMPALFATESHSVANSAMELLNIKERRTHDPERERQLLHLLLDDAEARLEIVDGIRPELFTVPTRVRILQTCQRLFAASQELSWLTVEDSIKRTTTPPEDIPVLLNELEAIGACPAQQQADTLLEALDDTYKCRTINQQIFTEANRRFTQNESIITLTDYMTDCLVKLDPRQRKRESFLDTMRRVYNQILHPDPTRQGLYVGLEGFDLQFGGIKRDRVYVIGGYTGSGKTAFIIDLIYRLLFYHHQRIAIKFFSLEMSNDRIAQRLFSRKALVSVKRQDDWNQPGQRELTDWERGQLKDAMGEFELLSQHIDVEYSTINHKQLKTEAKRFKLLNPDAHCIYFLDHIGMAEKNGENNRQAFDNIINTCKDIARDLDSSIFPLIQLAKAVEGPNNKSNYFRPDNSYVMESVGVEAAADAMMLLWRPGKHFQTIPYKNGEIDEMNFDVRNKLFAIIGKNRDGVGFNDLIFDCDMAHNMLRNPTPEDALPF